MFDLFSSDARLCKRGLQLYSILQEDEEGNDEYDGLGDEHGWECESPLIDCLPNTSSEEQVPDNINSITFEGEFADDLEVMKEMGLPLSFIQASKCKAKKVSLL